MSHHSYECTPYLAGKRMYEYTQIIQAEDSAAARARYVNMMRPELTTLVMSDVVAIRVNVNVTACKE